jgi:hypothetical protein
VAHGHPASAQQQLAVLDLDALHKYEPGLFEGRRDVTPAEALMSQRNSPIFQSLRYESCQSHLATPPS